MGCGIQQDDVRAGAGSEVVVNKSSLSISKTCYDTFLSIVRLSCVCQACPSINDMPYIVIRVDCCLMFKREFHEA